MVGVADGNKLRLLGGHVSLQSKSNGIFKQIIITLQLIKQLDLSS